MKAKSLGGKVCMITGSTDGIGRATACALAERGAHIIVVGRNRERGAALAESICAQSDSAGATFMAADLSSQAQIRELAARVSEQFPRLNVLINNAGAMFGKRLVSVDGIEMTFAVNHLAYMLLTSLLLPLLERAPPARIVNVASNAHRRAVLDFEDLQFRHRYQGWRAYQRSKLANLYFTYELARRLDPRKVTVNALHPGFVATEIGTAHRWTSRLVWRALIMAARGVSDGAETSIFLAGSPQVETITGGYFEDCRQRSSSRASRDQAAARKLWDVSAQMLGL